MEKIVKLLFTILLIVFPLGQIARLNLGEEVGLLLNDMVVFAVVSFWLVHKLLSRKPIETRSLTMPLFLFAVAALFSLIANLGKFPLSEIGIGSLYLLRFVLYGGLYFVVADFPQKMREKIPFWLVGTGSTLIFFGFIQYFLYPDLRNLYYLGWDEHLYRMFSTFLDPNFAGGIFVLTFLLALSIFFSLKRRVLLRLIFSGVLLGSFVGILLTYSRGSFISFAVGTTVFLFMAKRVKLILLLLITFAVGLFFLPKGFQSEGVKLFRTASIEARLTSTQHALMIFGQHPLFGVGFNTYRYEQERLGFLVPTKASYNRGAAGTDNSFLFVLTTTGIVGFLAYLNLWYRIIRIYRKNFLILSSITAICIHSFFVNSLFYPHVLAWLWILLAASKAGKSL